MRFRPAYVGTWRELFTASQLRRDVLPRLKAPGELLDDPRHERDALLHRFVQKGIDYYGVWGAALE